MARFIAGEDRRHSTFLPDRFGDYVAAYNPVRFVEVSVDELDLATLGFTRAVPEAPGRPAYDPATLLKIDIYDYLNRVPSNRRLERQTQRNIELMSLTGRPMPDLKTLADFRKDNGPAIQATYTQFVVLCRRLNLFSKAVVAIDGSKLKAVNNRDKNFPVAKVEARLAQVEASVARYLPPEPGRPPAE
ncbi:Transposase [Methylobacterium sp. ap11]|nr:Transposase [Methylobacterium sp. ap11]